jgi:hypothetical protein
MEQSDVRLVCLDGTEIPVDCDYGGVDSHGAHKWTLVSTTGIEITPGMSMLVTVPSVQAGRPARR